MSNYVAGAGAENRESKFPEPFEVHIVTTDPGNDGQSQEIDVFRCGHLKPGQCVTFEVEDDYSGYLDFKRPLKNGRGETRSWPFKQEFPPHGRYKLDSQKKSLTLDLKEEAKDDDYLVRFFPDKSNSTTPYNHVWVTVKKGTKAEVKSLKFSFGPDGSLAQSYMEVRYEQQEAQMIEIVPHHRSRKRSSTTLEIQDGDKWNKITVDSSIDQNFMKRANERIFRVRKNSSANPRKVEAKKAVSEPLFECGGTDHVKIVLEGGGGCTGGGDRP